MNKGRRFSIRTLRLLATLRDSGEITAGDIQSREAKEIMEYLTRQGVVSINRQKTRLRYTAPVKEKFLRAIGEYASILGNLDGAIRIAKGEKLTREDKDLLWGDSKTGGVEASESGFSLIPSSPVTVYNHKEPYRLTSNSALLVCDDGKELLLPEGWTIIIVENSRLFFRHDWLKHIGISEETARRCFIIKRYPITEEQFIFLRYVPLPVLYFGDLDLGGVSIYETEYKRKLGEKISFIIPPDVEERICGKSGNRELYGEQMKTMSNTTSPSGELTDVLRIIHKYQRIYEQEGYCYRLSE